MRLTSLPASAALAPLAVLALAACGGKTDGGSTAAVSVTNASQQEVAEKVAAAAGGENAMMVEPGRWEGVVKIEEMDIPGLPPQARDQMKAQMGRENSFVSCVTEEDVKAKRAFFTGDARDKSCTYDHFAMAGGKIDAAMKCDRGGDGAMLMTMNGRYAPQSYSMAITSQGQGEGPMAKMSMKMSVSAKRVGACKGSSDER